MFRRGHRAHLERYYHYLECYKHFAPLERYYRYL